MNKNLVLFLFLLGFFSCKDDQCTDDGKLTESEISWMPYYNGQTLVFENDSLGTDTLIVNVNRFFFDFVCPTSNCARSEASQAKFQLDSSEFLLSVAHYIECPKREAGPVIYWDGKRDFIKENNDSITIEINGIMYSNVRLLMNITNLSRNGNLFYSKTKGILSYQLSDSSVWTLAN